MIFWGKVYVDILCLHLSIKKEQSCADILLIFPFHQIFYHVGILFIIIITIILTLFEF